MSNIDQLLLASGDIVNAITGPLGSSPVTGSIRALARTKASLMINQRPRCLNCQTKLMLARITSGTSGFDIRTFECPACDQVHQIVVEPIDPMKSLQIAGWFRGELQAPTSDW
jgi:hypothetical protein